MKKESKKKMTNSEFEVFLQTKKGWNSIDNLLKDISESHKRDSKISDNENK